MSIGKKGPVSQFGMFEKPTILIVALEGFKKMKQMWPKILYYQELKNSQMNLNTSFESINYMFSNH